MGIIKWLYSVLRTIFAVLFIIPLAIWRIWWLRLVFLLVVVFLGVSWFFFYRKLPATIQVYDVMWLDQGWTEDQREAYYQTNQGTLIMPYSWFLALEMPPSFKLFQNTALFRDNDNTTRYRAIPDRRPKYNPDLLPVGMSKVVVNDNVLDLGLGHREWLSFGCPACHTGQITYHGLGIRVDGLQGMWDFSAFSQSMTSTLAITRFTPTKFDRFADKVLAHDDLPNNSQEREKLRKSIDQYLKWPLIQEAISTTINKTYPTVEGPGRTAALARGANGQFAPISRNNVREGTSPISFPPVWYTHDYDFVQSTAAIRQPLGRNVTESWGVNVIVDVTNSNPTLLFRSTHNLFNLFWMETLLSVLKHPRWPEGIFGQVDLALAEKGRYLYEEAVWKNPRDPAEEIWCGNAALPQTVNCNPTRVDAQHQKGYCARCHSPVFEQPLPPKCDPTLQNPCKAPLVQLTLYKLDVIGTDDADAKEFFARVGTMDPGNFTYRAAFAQADPVKYGVDPSKPNLGFGIGNGLAFTTDRVMDWWFNTNKAGMDAWVKAGVFPDAVQGRAVMEGFRANTYRAPLAYPARPMAGYWATAPYLHNHSVPNLYQLLSPASERSKTFYVGNTEFDPVNLGFESASYARGFRFDATKPGNYNTGHDFSAKPGDPSKPGVIGPMLSPDERKAILEYMKIIEDVKQDPAQLAYRRQLLEKMRQFFPDSIGGEHGKYAATPAPKPDASPIRTGDLR